MKCEKKYLSVLIITGILLFSIVGTISAMDKETYDKMDFWSKLKYNFYTGKILLFTSWGQANCCSENPDKEKWIKNGDRIDCDDYCSYDKCAIDVWYDWGVINLNTGQTTCPSGDPDWSNWVKEEAGEGEYFRGTSYPCYYVQVYCCPKECVTDDHETRVYVCENGEWDRKSKYGKDDSCPYDRGCWCADVDDNKYYDETGNEHCRSSPRSSWCTSCTSHATYSCYSNDIYWYDSCGNREDKKEDCGTAGCSNGVCEPVVSCVEEGYSCAVTSDCCFGLTCAFFQCVNESSFVCGDGICQYTETKTSCPEDCGAEPVCGDGICEAGETLGATYECLEDCPLEDCHTGELGSWGYCSSTCKCKAGEGDCDSIGTDEQCESGLVCVANVGANYGFSSGTDVCEVAPTCTSHATYSCYNNDVYWYDSCGNREEIKEDCGTAGCLGEVCNVASVCASGADSNNNGLIDRDELGDYINKWINSQVTRTKLGEIIGEWVNGC